MNRIYKVIWSKIKNCYVVTSELAKSHSKGCSGKRAGRILAAGAVVAGLLLPMGDAEAFSSSYYSPNGNSYGYGSQDYMTDGGHVDVSQIGGYDSNWGGYRNYVYVNEDGTIDFFKNENSQRNDISSLIGNVAIGNFAEAGSAADAKMLNFYNSSFQLAYETKPEGATGNWYQTTAPDGKQYWYASSWSDRTYAYSPTSSYGGSVIEKDGKYYHQNYIFEPELDENGNWQYDENGQPLGTGSYKYAEINSNIWKVDPDNPKGNLLVDYKKTETDEYGYVRPVFDLTAEDIGIDDSNPYAYSGGTNNVAVGNKSKTLSHSSVAVGDTSTARGWRSIAIGAQAETGADPDATYVGSWNDGTSAVAVGNSAKAYGSTSVAVGNGSQTYSFSGIAVGNGANASTEYGIAIGDNARVAYINGAGDIEQQRTAAQSIAIGRDAKAQAKDVTAVGRNAQGMMRNATAYGNNAHANAWNSIAIGNKATAGLQADIVNIEDGTAKDGTIGNSAVAIGNRARAEAEYTTAIGAGTWAEGWHAVAVGDSNRATGRFSTAIGAGWSINHTEGEPDSDDATDGSDAINTEGNRTYDSFGANQAGGDYSSAVGYGNMTVGTQSNAFGKENKVSGLSSLGVGAGNEVGTVAVGDNNVLEKPENQENTVSGYAVGSYNKITGTEGTNAGAFGANNTVAGDNAYAMGNGNEITEVSEKGIAIGNGNTVDGARSIAIGDGHTVTGEDNTVIGDPNTVEGDDNQVLANKSTVTGDRNIAIGNEVTVEANDGVAIGTSAQATVDGGVALGSTSVAKRDAANGGAGAGYDVVTGTNYAGDDADSPTWVSTLAAVSVGGTADDTDAEIGTAATATRQITGVAAGTADTDAVNVAQLRLAGARVKAGNNITVTSEKNENGGTDYTVNGLKTVITSTDKTVTINGKGTPDDKGVITYDLSVEVGDVDTNTTYKFETTPNADTNSNVVSTTKVKSSTDGKNYKETGETFNDTDTTYKLEQSADGKTITITNNYNAGDTVTLTDTDTDTHNGLKNDENTVVYNDKGEGSVTITDQDGNTTTINNIVNTTYTAEQTITAGEKPGEGSTTFSITDNNGNDAGSMIINAGDNITITKDEKSGAAVINAVDTTYSVTTKAGDEGTNIVNNYTMTGTNGDKYTFTDTDTKYELSGEKGEKAADGSTTYTVTLKDQAGNDAGSAVIVDTDTHNGLKNDENTVVYNDKGEGSVTITDQDGNTTTINGIKLGTDTTYTAEQSVTAGEKPGEGSTTFSITDNNGNDAGSMIINAGDNITITKDEKSGAAVINATDTTYKITEEAGKEGTNVVKKYTMTGTNGDEYTFEDTDTDTTYTMDSNRTKEGTTAATMSITDSNGTKIGEFEDTHNGLKNDDNDVTYNEKGEGTVTITDQDGNTTTINNIQNTTYKITEEAGKEGTNVVKKYTMTGTNGDEYTFEDTDTDTTYTMDSNRTKEGTTAATMSITDSNGTKIGEFKDTHNGLKNDGNDVTYNDKGEGTVTITDQDGNTTTINNIVNTTYTAEQTITAGEKPGEGSTTFNITDNNGNDAGSMTIKAGDNVTITKDGDTNVAVINAVDTTYSVTSEAGDEGTNIVNNYTMTGTNGDKYTFKDTDTTYKVTKEAGKEGTNVVNTYTMTGTNGDKYTFEDTDTDTTYTMDTNRIITTGKTAATMSIADSNGTKIGEFEDTHNGLKNDTNEVTYDDDGVGSVTITDQDGNTTTITNIRTGGGEGVADAVNRLGDQITRMDNKIDKVGAGAAALAGLHPLDFDPDEKWDFAAAVGSYKSEQAVALGAFYRPNEDTMFSIGGTIGNGNNMVNVGVSWKFGQKNRISANRISSAKEIIELRKNQEDVHSFLADAVAGNQLDLSKIQLFPDVEENHWAYDYVATMAGNGVLEGYPDGYFKGNRNMTRYEMAAVLYRLMQNGARLSDRALTEFAPELDRIRVDTITKHKDGTPHIQRVRTIKERVDEKADLSSEKAAKKKAKIKVAEKPVE